MSMPELEDKDYQEYWVVTLQPPKTLLDVWYTLGEAFPHTESFTITRALRVLKLKYPELNLNKEQVENIIENFMYQGAIAKESPDADDRRIYNPDI